MQAKQVTDKTRLYLKDMNKSKYSDWEIFNGINDAMRILADETAKSAGELFRDRATLTMAQSKSVLPERFIKEIKAFDQNGVELFNVQNDAPMTGEFSVKGNLAYSAESSIVLWYFKYPDPVDEFDDEIDLPESMIVPIAKVAALSVQGDNGEMVTMAKYVLGISSGEGSSKSK